MKKILSSVARIAVMLGLAVGSTALAQALLPTFDTNTLNYSATGGTVTLTSGLMYSGLTPSVYAFSVQLPPGWKFVSQSLGAGLSASASPAVNDNLLEWAFSGFPPNQLSWSFVVSYPAGLAGNQTISVPTAQYRLPITNLSVASLTIAAEVPTAPSITSQPQSQTATTGDRVTLAVGAAGSSPLNYQWRKDGAVLGGATASTYVIASAQSGDAGSYTVDVSNNVGSVRSNAAVLTVSALPRLSDQPRSQQVLGGTAVAFSISASGAGPLNYQWYKDNVAIVGATNSSYSIASAHTGDAGTYTVVVWNSAGSVTSNSATLTVAPSARGTRFVNIATRAYCTTNNGVAIGGFVIDGTDSKQVLIRAVGPTLSKQGLGENEVLLDPQIELHKGVPVIARNDNWGDNANALAIVATAARIGAAPLDVSDTKSSALLLTLDPGVYSFIASGKSATSGIVLVEVYDAD